MFKYVVSAAILFFTQCVLAAEECPPAAEVAEMQNPNKYQNCDYSNEGLNGVLHRAFAKNKSSSSESVTLEPATSESATSKSATSKKLVDKVATMPDAPSPSGQRQQTIKLTFENPSQLNELRSAHIVRLLANCKGRFEIVKELYRTLSVGNYELALQTQCISE